MRITAIDRLTRFARWAGANVEIVDRVPSAVSAPFGSYVGLDWDHFVVFVERDRQGKHYVIGSAIHELGHLLATSDRPDDSAEGDFAAWEWRLAIHLGIVTAWRRSMFDYVVVGPGKASEDFGRMSNADQRRWLQRCMQRGRKIGNVSPSGLPVMLRGPKAGQSPPDVVT